MYPAIEAGLQQGLRPQMCLGRVSWGSVVFLYASGPAVGGLNVSRGSGFSGLEFRSFGMFRVHGGAAASCMLTVLMAMMLWWV